MLRFRVYIVCLALFSLGTIGSLRLLTLEVERLNWVQVEANLVDPVLEFVPRGLGRNWRVRANISWVVDGTRYGVDRSFKGKRLHSLRGVAEAVADRGSMPIWIDPEVPQSFVDAEPSAWWVCARLAVLVVFLLLLSGTAWRASAARRWVLRSSRWTDTASPTNDLETFETCKGTWVGASLRQIRGFWRTTGFLMGSLITVGAVATLTPPHAVEYHIVDLVFLVLGAVVMWRYFRGLFRYRAVFIDPDDLRVERSGFWRAKVLPVPKQSVRAVHLERRRLSEWRVSLAIGPEGDEVAIYDGNDRETAEWLTDQLNDWAGIRTERRRTQGPADSQLPGARWTLKRDPTLRRVGSASKWPRR